MNFTIKLNVDIPDSCIEEARKVVPDLPTDPGELAVRVVQAPLLAAGLGAKLGNFEYKIN